ncbi:MAG: FeoB-associated Cys-rich membrane protein [Herbinix sp.]|nr:FeoB-associated Cys-rich membrane protein [Herbinix sp.]
MIGIVLGAFIIGYTGFVIYKKTKDIKAGKSCCGGCSSCSSKNKCSSL